MVICMSCFCIFIIFPFSPVHPITMSRRVSRPSILLACFLLSVEHHEPTHGTGLTSTALWWPESWGRWRRSSPPMVVEGWKGHRQLPFGTINSSVGYSARVLLLCRESSQPMEGLVLTRLQLKSRQRFQRIKTNLSINIPPISCLALELPVHVGHHLPVHEGELIPGGEPAGVAGENSTHFKSCFTGKRNSHIISSSNILTS